MEIRSEKPADPLDIFAAWLAEAEAAEPNDPTAMALATVGEDGMPSCRMVLLKGYDRSGFVFYTNYESRKGRQLLATPKAALLFHWKSLRRQVRIEGPVMPDRKSTRLNSSHVKTSYAVFCLKKKQQRDR